MLYDNVFREKDINPNNEKFQLKGTYTKRFVYVDKVKTDEVMGLKLDVQLVDPALFFPTFTVYVPIKEFVFNAHDIVEFNNIRGKFGVAFGKGN
ncbi:hypothetical protein DW588_06305, partial [Enterococcus faecalis]|nr:hypothetical protein [Enterococcus faecalis]